MLIEYRGHSEFLLTDLHGTRLLIDPCAPYVGYGRKTVEADIAVVSHDHDDHSYLEKCTGDPYIIRKEGIFYPDENIQVQMIPCFHDDKKGALRGKNLMAKINMGKVNFLHMGDIGHLLNEELIRRIGQVDVLMIPVGGYYTIDAKQAARTVEMIKPRVVIPMHYKTKVNWDWPIAPVDDFLNEIHAPENQRQTMPLLRVTPQDLSEQPYLCVLEPRN